MTNEQILEAIITTVPYPSHMSDIEFETEPNAVRFTWRGDKFRVSEGLTETVQGAFLHGDNEAILMQAVVGKGFLRIYEREAKAGKKQ